MWLVGLRIMAKNKHMKNSGNYEKKENSELVRKHIGF